MLLVSIYIASIATLLFLAIWTVLRFKKIAQGKTLPYYNKVFWSLALLTLASWTFVLISYFVQ